MKHLLCSVSDDVLICREAPGNPDSFDWHSWPEMLHRASLWIFSLSGYGEATYQRAAELFFEGMQAPLFEFTEPELRREFARHIPIKTYQNFLIMPGNAGEAEIKAHVQELRERAAKMIEEAYRFAQPSARRKIFGKARKLMCMADAFEGKTANLPL